MDNYNSNVSQSTSVNSDTNVQREQFALQDLVSWLTPLLASSLRENKNAHDSHFTSTLCIS